MTSFLKVKIWFSFDHKVEWSKDTWKRTFTFYFIFVSFLFLSQACLNGHMSSLLMDTYDAVSLKGGIYWVFLRLSHRTASSPRAVLKLPPASCWPDSPPTIIDHRDPHYRFALRFHCGVNEWLSRGVSTAWFYNVSSSLVLRFLEQVVDCILVPRARKEMSPLSISIILFICYYRYVLISIIINDNHITTNIEILKMVESFRDLYWSFD